MQGTHSKIAKGKTKYSKQVIESKSSHGSPSRGLLGGARFLFGFSVCAVFV